MIMKIENMIVVRNATDGLRRAAQNYVRARVEEKARMMMELCIAAKKFAEVQDG